MQDQFYYKSACCGAPVNEGGDSGEGQTNFYVCSKCDNPCDVTKE